MIPTDQPLQERLSWPEAARVITLLSAVAWALILAFVA